MLSFQQDGIIITMSGLPPIAQPLTSHSKHGRCYHRRQIIKSRTRLRKRYESNESTRKPVPPSQRRRYVGKKDSTNDETGMTEKTMRIAKDAMKLFMMTRSVVEPESTVALQLVQDETVLWSATGAGTLGEEQPTSDTESSFYSVKADHEDDASSEILHSPYQPDEELAKLDIVTCRSETTRTYNKIVSYFKKEISLLRLSLSTLKNENSELSEGGGKFAETKRELSWLASCCDEAQSKIKDLIQLLGKCSDRIKYLEDANNKKDEALAKPQKVNWGELHKVFGEFVIANRTDTSILKEICKRVSSVKLLNIDLTCRMEKLRESASLNEVNAEDREQEATRLRSENHRLKLEKSVLVGESKELTEELSQERLRCEKQYKSITGLEFEKTKLTDMLLSLKASMAKTLSHHKPYFIGMGKQKSIPMHLRYTGKINNLNIEKGTLERVISDIWSFREMEWLAKVHQQQQFRLGQNSGSIGVTRTKIPKRTGGAISLWINNPTWLDHARQDFSNIDLCVQLPKTFPEFVSSYITDRYKNAAEWGYSIADGCERFKYDADVELFHSILNGYLPEDAFYDQTAMMEKLKMAILECDAQETMGDDTEIDWVAVVKNKAAPETAAKAHRGSFRNKLKHDEDFPSLSEFKTKGSLSGRKIVSLLQSFFPAKTEENSKHLKLALLENLSLLKVTEEASKSTESERITALLNIPEIPYRQLFASDSKGNQGAFIEAIRDQYIEEVKIHTTDMVSAITSADGVGCPSSFVSLRVVLLNALCLDRKPMHVILLWLELLIKDSKAEFNFTLETIPKEFFEVGPVVERAKTIICKRYRPNDIIDNVAVMEIVNQLKITEDSPAVKMALETTANSRRR